MKVYAAGALVAPGSQFTPAEAMHYVLSLDGVSTTIIGCSTPGEVETNVRTAIQYQPLTDQARRDIEQRSSQQQAMFTSYKRR
jgi:predicted aldo/keto reductase-like oxidoreductase